MLCHAFLTMLVLIKQKLVHVIHIINKLNVCETVYLTKCVKPSAHIVNINHQRDKFPKIILFSNTKFLKI